MPVVALPKLVGRPVHVERTHVALTAEEAVRGLLDYIAKEMPEWRITWPLELQLIERGTAWRAKVRCDAQIVNPGDDEPRAPDVHLLPNWDAKYTVPR